MNRGADEGRTPSNVVAFRGARSNMTDMLAGNKTNRLAIDQALLQPHWSLLSHFTQAA